MIRSPSDLLPAMLPEKISATRRSVLQILLCHSRAICHWLIIATLLGCLNAGFSGNTFATNNEVQSDNSRRAENSGQAGNSTSNTNTSGGQKEAVEQEGNAAKSGLSSFDATLESLILQLADSNYANREAAQQEILNLGISALKRLQSAAMSVDPQIASASRFLLKSNQFSWANDFDSVRLKLIFANYGQVDSTVKRDLIEQLAVLIDGEGLDALCRIVRYETAEEVTKYAALKILEQEYSSKEQFQLTGEIVRQSVQNASNDASSWLVKHFTEEAFDIPWWIDQVKKDLQSIAEKQSAINQPGVMSAGSTQDDSLFLFSQWVVKKLLELGDREAALAVGNEVVKVLPTDIPSHFSRWEYARSSNENFMVWALDSKLPELVVAQHKNLHPKLLYNYPMFGYYLAEAVQANGNKTLGDEIAEKAFQRKVVNEVGDLFNPTESEAGANNLNVRNLANRNADFVGSLELVIANALKKRGKFDWAIRELSKNLDDSFTSIITIRSMYEIAAIHHSLENFEAAKEALKPLINRYEKEPLFAQQIGAGSGAVSTIISAYYQFAGDADRATGNDLSAMVQYIRAMDASKENVDAIIGMYQLDVEEAFREKRKQYRNSAVKRLEKLCSELEIFYRLDAANRAPSMKTELAIQLNSLAWLIANTEGDFVQALHYSRTACELSPKSPEFLDTLAHAYYATGDYSNAIATQTRAIKMMPNVPEFHRALAKFEAKLSESNSN